MTVGLTHRGPIALRGFACGIGHRQNGCDQKDRDAVRGELLRSRRGESSELTMIRRLLTSAAATVLMASALVIAPPAGAAQGLLPDGLGLIPEDVLSLDVTGTGLLGPGVGVDNGSTSAVPQPPAVSPAPVAPLVTLPVTPPATPATPPVTRVTPPVPPAIPAEPPATAVQPPATGGVGTVQPAPNTNTGDTRTPVTAAAATHSGGQPLSPAGAGSSAFAANGISELALAEDDETAAAATRLPRTLMTDSVPPPTLVPQTACSSLEARPFL
jgi:hypothetical protein